MQESARDLRLSEEPVAEFRDLATQNPQEALTRAEGKGPAEWYGVGVAFAERHDRRGIDYAAGRFAEARTAPLADLVEQMRSTPQPVEESEVTREGVEEVARGLGGLIGSKTEEIIMGGCWRQALWNPDAAIDTASRFEANWDNATAAWVGAALGCARDVEVEPSQEHPADTALQRVVEVQRRQARALPAEIWADLRPDQR